MPHDRTIRLHQTPITEAWADEARAIGVSPSMLITADLVRLRGVLAASQPKLTQWEWDCISHVMDDEGMALLTDREMGERIVSGDRLYIALTEWADGAMPDQMLIAEQLAVRARSWSDVERWALMVRRRMEYGR